MPVWLIAFEAAVAAIPTIIQAIAAITNEVKSLEGGPTAHHIATLNNLHAAIGQLHSATRSLLPTA